MCFEATSTLGALKDKLANELTEGEKGEQNMLYSTLQLVKLVIQNVEFHSELKAGSCKVLCPHTDLNYS